MDVWHWFADRERELRELSLAKDTLEVAEKQGSNGQRGRLIGRAFLNQDAYIQFAEVIQVDGTGAHRESTPTSLCR